MFEPKDVAEYYNTTQNHYERWWDLKKSLSLHYGIWTDQTKSFSESIRNTNRTLFELAEIEPTDHVLDAGCGVGGAAVYIHTNCGAKVTGISLSEKQIAFAHQYSVENNLTDSIDFKVQDYSKTSFADQSFDAVWACESISSAPDEELFVKEVARVLKKGGRLVLSDCFVTKDGQEDKNQWMKKWDDTWAIGNRTTSQKFVEGLKKHGFSVEADLDYTDNVAQSARRMYYAALLGSIPSRTYNFFNPKVSRFAKIHYKSGIYQYKAFNENLWRYKVIKAVKL